jgi:vacuolar-type H+-ATPase catalytic subunit A/Vma1
MDKIAELKFCVDTIAQDTSRFFKKNNRTAGVRARKKLQTCKKLAQEIRLLIQKAKQEEVQKKAEVASKYAAEAGSDHLTKKVFQTNDSFMGFPGIEDPLTIGNNGNFRSDPEEKNLPKHAFLDQINKNNELGSSYGFNGFGFLPKYS